MYIFCVPSNFDVTTCTLLLWDINVHDHPRGFRIFLGVQLTVVIEIKNGPCIHLKIIRGYRPSLLINVLKIRKVCNLT